MVNEIFITQTEGLGYIEKGQNDRLAVLLDTGVCPNMSSAYGLGGLRRAMEMNNITAVKLLLGAGANPNLPDNYAIRPIDMAVKIGSIEGISLLLKYKADPFLHAQDAESAFETALKMDSSKILETILSNFQERPLLTFCPFNKAITSGKAVNEKLVLLLNNGYNPCGSETSKPIHNATEGNLPQIVDFLCKSNVDLEARNAKGLTPLHIAAAKGFSEVVSTLISYGAWADSPSASEKWRGSTPLHFAIVNGHVEAVRLLLAAGANVEEKNNDGFNAMGCVLHSSLSEKSKESIKAVLFEAEKKSEWQAAALKGANIRAELLMKKQSSNSSSSMDMEALVAEKIEERLGFSPSGELIDLLASLLLTKDEEKARDLWNTAKNMAGKELSWEEMLIEPQSGNRGQALKAIVIGQTKFGPLTTSRYRARPSFK